MTKKKLESRMLKAKTTKRMTITRAYTVRLRADRETQQALWQTHRVINLGSAVCADWLLTMGGGISPKIIEEDQWPLLALAWLTVESGAGDVTPGLQPEEVATKLEQVLKLHAIDQDRASQLVSTCALTLSASIREDANWIDRSKAFESLSEELGIINIKLARQDALTLWIYLFGYDVFSFDKENTVAKSSGAGAGRRTTHLFSYLFGEAPMGFGKTEVGRYKLHYRTKWARYLKKRLEREAGIRLLGGKDKGLAEARQADKSARTNSVFLREMFFRAAEMISAYRSNLKIQESERRALRANETGIIDLELNPNTSAPCKLLDRLREQRELEINSSQTYFIRDRALVGWEEVVTAWSRCSNEEQRRQANARLQSEANEGKWGDAILFNTLAGDDYIPVWRDKLGKPRPEFLLHYSQGWLIRRNVTRLKVPVFRYPDPYEHPICARFGQGRPELKIRFSRGDQRLPLITAVLWNGKQAKSYKIEAGSIRLVGELGPTLEEVETTVVEPTRRTKLAALALQCANKETESASGTISSDSNLIEEIFSNKVGASIQAPRELLRTAHEKEDRIPWYVTLSPHLRPSGPWIEFVKTREHALTPEMDKGLIVASLPPHRAKLSRWRGLAYPFRRQDVPVPFGQLSGLPGLRVLGVDLRQSFGAACAMLESISSNEFERIRKKAMREGKNVVVDSLWAHLPGVGLLRRIGDDQAPAPWAKIVFQRAIRLEGEGRNDLRKLNSDEKLMCEELRALLEVENLPGDGYYLNVVSAYLKEILFFLRRQSGLARTTAALRAGGEPLSYTNKLLEAGLTSKQIAGKSNKVAERASKLWQQKDQHAAKALRILSGMLRPRDHRFRTPGKGGVSIARIEMLENFSKAQSAFHCRPTPEQDEGKPMTANFNASLQGKITRLKRQRSRLLASIVPAHQDPGNDESAKLR